MKGRPTIAKRKHKMTGFDARKKTFDCDSSSERSGISFIIFNGKHVSSGHNSALTFERVSYHLRRVTTKLKRFLFKTSTVLSMLKQYYSSDSQR